MLLLQGGTDLQHEAFSQAANAARQAEAAVEQQAKVCRHVVVYVRCMSAGLLAVLALLVLGHSHPLPCVPQVHQKAQQEYQELQLQLASLQAQQDMTQRSTPAPGLLFQTATITQTMPQSAAIGQQVSTAGLPADRGHHAIQHVHQTSRLTRVKQWLAVWSDCGCRL